MHKRKLGGDGTFMFNNLYTTLTVSFLFSGCIISYAWTKWNYVIHGCNETFLVGGEEGLILSVDSKGALASVVSV